MDARRDVAIGRTMAPHRARRFVMRRALIIAFTAAAAPAWAGEDGWRERWSERGLEFGASAVAEMLHATQARNWPARVDLSASVEADLGELTGWSPLHVYGL